jgi:type VI protein secretion system component VasK
MNEIKTIGVLKIEKAFDLFSRMVTQDIKRWRENRTLINGLIQDRYEKLDELNAQIDVADALDQSIDLYGEIKVYLMMAEHYKNMNEALTNSMRKACSVRDGLFSADSRSKMAMELEGEHD